jgi:hypothetical protein
MGLDGFRSVALLGRGHLAKYKNTGSFESLSKKRIVGVSNSMQCTSLEQIGLYSIAEVEPRERKEMYNLKKLVYANRHIQNPHKV